MVNILTTNSILVNIDIILCSYVSAYTQPTIYSFPNISPGYKIIENPHNLLYIPITADTIHSITIWLIDQNANELNSRGENLSMRLHLRKINKNILSFKMTSYTNVKVRISEAQKTSSRKHLNQVASLSQFVSRLPI